MADGGAVRRTCANHPTVTAKWQCPTCERFYCHECLAIEEISGQIMELCPECRDQCVQYEPKAPGIGEKSFLEMLPSAFLYPFRGDGVIAYATGVVALFVGIAAAGYAWGKAGLFGLAITFAVWLLPFGYWCGYLMEMLARSARGTDKGPPLPEFSNWLDDMVYPLFVFVGTGALSFSPLLLHVYTGSGAGVGGRALYWVLFLAGVFLYPVLLSAAAAFRTLAALKPWFLISVVLKVPGEYGVASVLMLASALLLLTEASWFGQILGGVVNVAALPAAVYLLMVEMRILGLIWWTNRKKLGWLAEE